MDFTVALYFVNLFFAGILAGIEIVIHYGLRAPSASLDEQSQIKLRQALVLRLRVLVPAFFLPTALSAIAAAVLDSGTSAFWLRGVGLVAMLMWILIRIV